MSQKNNIDDLGVIIGFDPDKIFGEKDKPLFVPDNVLLTNIEELKKESYLDDNVSNESIRHAIIFVQDSIAEKVTGTCLMNQLKCLIAECKIDDDPHYAWYRRLLYTYIFPILANGVQSELAIKLTLKERNQGVIRNNDAEHLQYPGLADVKAMKSDYDRNTDFYINRAIKFLRCNSKHFCELCGCDCRCDCNEAPFQMPYSTGTYTGPRCTNRSPYT